MRPILLALTGAALVAVPTSASAAVNFLTPSRNIACYVDASGARCDIKNHTYPTPKRPASCPLEYGDSLGVDRGAARGHWVCHGDTVFGATRVVAYGTTVRVGTLRCTVSTAGVRCLNKPGGGFFLSKQAARIIRA